MNPSLLLQSLVLFLPFHGRLSLCMFLGSLCPYPALSTFLLPPAYSGLVPPCPHNSFCPHCFSGLPFWKTGRPAASQLPLSSTHIRAARSCDTKAASVQLKPSVYSTVPSSTWGLAQLPTGQFGASPHLPHYVSISEAPMWLFI